MPGATTAPRRRSEVTADPGTPATGNDPGCHAQGIGDTRSAMSARVPGRESRTARPRTVSPPGITHPDQNPAHDNGPSRCAKYRRRWTRPRTPSVGALRAAQSSNARAAYRRFLGGSSRHRWRAKCAGCDGRTSPGPCAAGPVHVGHAGPTGTHSARNSVARTTRAWLIFVAVPVDMIGTRRWRRHRG